MKYHPIHITDADHQIKLWTDFTDVSCNTDRRNVSLNTAIQRFVIQVTVLPSLAFTFKTMCSGIYIKLTCHCVTPTVNRCTGVLTSPYTDHEGNKLERPNSNFCKPLKKKNQKVVFPNRSPRQQWPPRRTKNGESFNSIFSRVGLRTYQHPCNTNRRGFVSR